MESISIEPLPASLALFSFTGIDFIFISIILFLAFVSAVLTSFQRAFQLLSRNDIAEIKNNSSTSSNIIANLSKRSDLVDTSLSIANFLVRISLIFLSALLIINSIQKEYIVIASIIVVIILLFFISLLCDFLPKEIASRKKEKILLRYAIVIRVTIAIFMPLGNLFRKISKAPKTANSNALSGEEFSEVIEIAEGREDLETETQMLKGILRFSDLDVKEIMKSRMDIVAFDWDDSLEEIIKKAGVTGYSRIPVYEESIDNIKGILYVKDMLPHIVSKDDFDWHMLIRPPFFIPEFKAVSQLLNDFQLQKIHLAIIVDEYGGTSGIVTLEDIIEEIVGEITDEYDNAETNFKKINDSVFLFEAKTNLIDFCKIIGLNDDSIFDDIKGDSDSLAGLILEMKGGIPEKGEKISIGQFTFQVEAASNRRIESVKVTIYKQKEELQ